jgi:catechol 2,3-dioxygenase-like lactoylglutathione lyase family enzyme
MKRFGVVFTIALLLASVSASQEAQPSVGAVPLRVAKPAFFALLVPDVAKAVEWYGDTFGLTLVKEANDPNGTFAISILRSEELIVELIEDERSFAIEERLPGREKRERAHGIFKVGFEVQGLDRLREALEARGAILMGEIVLDVELGQRTFLLVDPFGNRLQFFERVE